MSRVKLEFLSSLLDHVEYYNKLAPFPIYDTEYVESIKEEIIKVRESVIDYDNLPVVACGQCKSLHIVVDEEYNNICMRCNSINEIVEFDNIHEYKKDKNIWNE